MSAKQKILHGRGPSNLNLGILVAPLMFAGLPNHSSLLTMHALIEKIFRKKKFVDTFLFFMC